MKTFAIQLTEREMQIVGIALQNMPYKDVSALLVNIDQQIRAQTPPIAPPKAVEDQSVAGAS